MSVRGGGLELQEEQLPSALSTGTVLFLHSEKNMLGQISVEDIFIYLCRITASMNLAVFFCSYVSWFLSCDSQYLFFFPAKLVSPKILQNTDVPVVQNGIIFSAKKSVPGVTSCFRKNVTRLFVYVLFCGKLFLRFWSA